MNHEAIQKQFSVRVATFNSAARWMLDEGLLLTHLETAGSPPKGARGLDLCCGTGIVGKALQTLGWDMTGIDLTTEMAEEANRHFPAVAGSVDQMPFQDQSFDLAVLRQSYMLLDAAKTLAEIRRTLKKDGRFILSQSVPFSSADAPRYREVQLARHINIVKTDTAETLLTELNDQGFYVEEMRFIRVRESVDQWLARAPELSVELRAKIRGLIESAPAGYQSARNVKLYQGELFEDWNWVVFRARNRE